MTEPKDFFDRIMALPFLSHFRGFYLKNKSVLLYLFFGALTTVVSVGSFILLNTGFGANEHIANVCSWILAVLFAYLTNRTWVFASKEKGKAILKELCSFFLGRVASFALEELLLFVFVTVLMLNSTMIKIAAQFAVLVTNYLLSKYIVFRK